MENASKALIIAGAILLSIAIIGIGMSVFNGAQEAVNNANMDATEIQAFNNKFENFEGPRKKGSDVKSLIDTVRTHNNAYADDISKCVLIERNDAGEADNPADILDDGDLDGVDYADLKSNIATGRTYEVTVGYTANGLISHIVISQN